MRVTRDVPTIGNPMWMVGDSAYDMLDWHDLCGQPVVVPVAPYNAQNTDDPKDIEYRVEDRTEKHSADLQLKQSTLDETYNRRTGRKQTSDAGKIAASGTSASEAASTHDHRCSQSGKYRDYGVRRVL